MLVNVPQLDVLLERHAAALGADFTAYRNHTYRIANFHCLLDAAGSGIDVDLDKLAIAAAYHDLGIWTGRSLDYLAPSVALATAYLDEIGRAEWRGEITAMIDNHHKLTRCRAGVPASAETFRRADWIDLSLGRLRFGLARCAVADVLQLFPNAGFHRLLLRLSLRRIARHPLRPLPMLRW
jgi:hypothetical protein